MVKLMSTQAKAYAGPDFDYDVFVSYAWVNNDPKGTAGTWVSDLQERLQTVLDERLGRAGSSRFFFDRDELSRTKDFRDHIEQALNRTAVFVAVISQGYVASVMNSMEELRHFAEEVLNGEATKSGRLFLVWYEDPASVETWDASQRDAFQQHTKNVLGFEFFEALTGVPSGKPLEPLSYQTGLLRLTTAIAAKLKDLEPEKTERVPATNGIAKSDRPTILLGPTFVDRQMRKRRANFVDWCRNDGCHVLGDGDNSPSKEDFAADLARASVFVQLFTDSWLPSDEDEYPTGIEAWQVEQARTCGVEILQWRSVKMLTDEELEKIEDPVEQRHLKLISHPDVLEVDPLELHRLAVDKAKDAAKTDTKTVQSDVERSLLVKVAQSDYQQHESTLLELSQQAECRYAHNGRSVVDRYRKRKFDAVMIVLGDGADEDWREDRTDEFIESIQSFRETGPIHAWYRSDTWQGAPPFMAPGVMLISGEQELPKLFEAIEARTNGGAQ